MFTVIVESVCGQMMVRSRGVRVAGGFKQNLGFEVEDYEKEWQKDLPFDKYALDDEYAAHPMTYMRWVRIFAGAAAARKAADEAVKTEELRLFLTGKKDPAEFGFDAKPTDSMSARNKVSKTCKQKPSGCMRSTNAWSIASGHLSTRRN